MCLPLILVPCRGLLSVVRAGVIRLMFFPSLLCIREILFVVSLTLFITQSSPRRRGLSCMRLPRRVMTLSVILCFLTVVLKLFPRVRVSLVELFGVELRKILFVIPMLQQKFLMNIKQLMNRFSISGPR